VASPLRLVGAARLRLVGADAPPVGRVLRTLRLLVSSGLAPLAVVGLSGLKPLRLVGASRLRLLVLLGREKGKPPGTGTWAMWLLVLMGRVLGKMPGGW